MSGSQLYPAAGFLVMVVEAARQLCGADTPILGYRLRDVTIHNAVIVPDTEDGIELQLHMSALEATAPGGKQQNCWTYRIYAMDGADVRLISSGCAAVEQALGTDITPVENCQELESHEQKAQYERTQHECSRPIPTEKFYQSMEEAGGKMGASFQTLNDIYFEPQHEQARTSLTLGHWKTIFPDVNIQDHVIHPSTLDAIFQLPHAAVLGAHHRIPAMLPTHVENAWISHDLGIRELDFASTLVDPDTGKILIALNPIRFTAISSLVQGGLPAEKIRQLCYKFDWKPDLSLMTNDDITSYCQAATSSITAPWDPVDNMICLHFLSRALGKHYATKHNSTASQHIERYIDWASRSVKSATYKELSLLKRWRDTNDDEEGFLRSYAMGSPCRNAYVKWGHQLPAILREEVISLSSVQRGLSDRYLSRSRLWPAFPEVGAGTGSGTEHIIRALTLQGQSEGTPRYGNYDFTDISPSFFQDARVRFEKHGSRIQFKTLDIEQDPMEQGFNKDQYDVITAVSVLHATACIDDTLRHLRTLLKPGGYLLLVEPTNTESIFSPYVSAALPGWWRSPEANPSAGPLYTGRQWGEALVRNGFTGTDVYLPDHSDEASHILSFIATRASDEFHTLSARPQVFIVADQTSQQQIIASATQSCLGSHGYSNCSIVDLSTMSAQDCSEVACIFLLDLERSFLAEMNETEYAALKHIINIAKHLICLTNGGGEKPLRPETDLVTGFSKTISIENPTLHLCHADIESARSAASTVLALLDEFLKASTRDVEIQVAEKNGLIYVPRVVEAVDMNLKYEATFGSQHPMRKTIGQDSSDSLELHFSPGRLDGLHHVVTQPEGTLQEGEIEVQVKATGINFKDVMVALGQLSDNHIGQEFAGVVTRVGLGTHFVKGTRVCGIVEGSFKTFVKVDERVIMSLPKNLSFVEAAAIPLAFLTAHYALTHLAKLRKGESVLIHAAAGAVGQAAIQLAQRHGATIYVTVSSPAKKQLLMDRFQLDETHFFSSRSTSFSQRILNATGGRGVDVVLNSLAGQLLTETWRVVAPLGRFIEIGKRDINAFAHLPMAPFAKNVTFSSLDISVLYEHNLQLLEQLMCEVKETIHSSSGCIVPPFPIEAFRRSEFEGAFRYLQTGKHSGKAVVDWVVEDTLQIIPEPPKPYRFSPDGTYIIAGGLGGIGRSIARWMATRGVKNMILLSRSGAKTSAAQELLLQELINMGVHVEAPACDISDFDKLTNVIRRSGRTMPPIRGCIQGSMAVQNGIFDKMSLAEFNTTMPSKVAGTWNLHNSLPSDLDFFIMLSSICGVGGSSAQCNYAAACSFQDAFARYRHSLGQQCTSLDLGVVSSIGYIAERVDIAKIFTLAHTGHDTMDEREVLFMVEQAISNPIPMSATPWSTQILAALTTPALVRKKGLLEEHAWMQKPLFRHLYQIDKDSAASSFTTTAKTDYCSLLRSCQTLEEAGAVISKGLAQRLSRSLAVPEEDIDLHKPAHAFGVDSLVAVELQFWFSNELKADLPVLHILSGTTILGLGIMAAEKSALFAKVNE